MDIRKWLNKGTSQKFKDDLKASKKGRKALDSSDEETEKENPKLKTPKPVPEKVKTAVSPKDFFKKKNKTPEKTTKKRKASDDVEFVASTLTPVKKSKVETTKRKSPEVKSTAQSSQDNLPKPELPMPVKKEKSLPNVKALEIKKSASEDAMDTDSAPKTPAEVRKANYLKFKAKASAGPRNPGSKEIPTGADNCLEGLTFVATGNGESLGRDEMKSLIQRYGGKFTTSVSGKTSYVIVGEEPGEAKIKKAKEKDVKLVDEDFILELIRSKPAKKSKYEIVAEEEAAREAKNTPKKKAKISPRKAVKNEVKEEPKSSPKKTMTALSKDENSNPALMWVEKYKPAEMKKIVGQSGNASCANKLQAWLKDWQKHQGGPKDQRPKAKFAGARGAIDPTGHTFRAALLSGPPGIGKTTTAHLVAKSLGFELLEFNASDTRSKKSLASVVKGAMTNSCIDQAFKSVEKKVVSGKYVLIMDEVDGMAGNEDRGGIAELIGLIKISSIPVICICNDRQHPKIRSLANYVFDLRFMKPRVEQITGAMMSICFKEKFKIAPAAVQEVIRSCNQDVRQTIHTLNMMAVNKKDDVKVEYDDAKSTADGAKKDIKIGPFEALPRIFRIDKTQPQPQIIDKHELFFQDYSLMPKMVFENYLKSAPASLSPGPQKNAQHLQLIAKSASALSYSEIAERKIMSKQAWSLLPTVATLSTVLPGQFMGGGLTDRVDFPKELGKMSTTNKNGRIADQLKMHTRLQSKCDRWQIVSSHGPTFRERLSQPLVRQSKGELGASEGVQQVMKFLDDYSLTKDDMDNIFDLTQWTGTREPLAGVDSKTKASLTRAYNKSSAPVPFAVDMKIKKKKKAAGASADDEDGESAEESEEDEEALIAAMKKKKPAKKVAAKKPAAKKTKK